MKFNFSKNQLLVTSALVAVIVIAAFNQKSSKGLELPTCDMPKPVMTTVNFFIDGEVNDAESLKKQRDKIQDHIEHSNTILNNSCIPILRAVGEVKVVGQFSDDSKNMYELHKELLSLVGDNTIKNIRENPGEYYVLVLNKSHPFISKGVMGKTHTNFNDSYVVLSKSAKRHVLEHELGHLAWAMHPEPKVSSTEHIVNTQVLEEHHHKVKPYARGYFCGDAGTVMTYAKNRVPAYSNPNTKYQDEVCGDLERGDNARVLKEYAKQLIELREASK